ncbi:MAG: hypothetical protein AUG44_11140 [Actinobacteria bacterium 13_1_20CM_3_71_11]|nr:MAG: hypothetical protein AUG44_11140 [Actinobacteria bacterium 13_1_20CM_3_71_11]
MRFVQVHVLAAVAVASAVLSWLGLYLHNSVELPDQSLLSPETTYPTLVYLLGIAARFIAGRRAAAWLLLGWGWLLPIWPYDPPQTARHYTFHLLYGLLEIPMIVVMTRLVRSTTTSRKPHA